MAQPNSGKNQQPTRKQSSVPKQTAKLEKDAKPEQTTKQSWKLEKTVKSKQVDEPRTVGLKIGEPGYLKTVDKVGDDQIAVCITVPWLATACKEPITRLIEAPVLYEFKDLPTLCQWAQIDILTTKILEVVKAEPSLEDTDTAKEWKTWYSVIETQRQEFERLGEQATQQNQAFTFLGLSYTLRKQGTRHYYISRRDKPIVYAEKLTGRDAKALVHRMQENEAFEPNATHQDYTHVDDFVCAFFAEPTRCPQEHIFNLMVLKDSVKTAVTGRNANPKLPMAGGGTWEPDKGVLGSRAPQYIVDFARYFELFDMIRDAIQNGAADVDQLCVAVCARLMP